MGQRVNNARAFAAGVMWAIRLLRAAADRRPADDADHAECLRQCARLVDVKARDWGILHERRGARPLRHATLRGLEDVDLQLLGRRKT